MTQLKKPKKSIEESVISKGTLKKWLIRKIKREAQPNFRT